MPILRIQLLGDFHLNNDTDESIAINQARQQALLAYLLLHRHAPQSRQYLAFLLWPDSSETQALANLRKTLTHFRQAAPILAQTIFADHKVIQWRPALSYLLDVADFEEKLAQATVAQQAGRQSEAIPLLAAAVALYRGPLLPSCYDDWIMAERERLHQLCLQALGQLVVIQEQQRDFATAIHYVQQLLRLDPLQETPYLQLMEFQALLGNRAAALRTYHTCATMLKRELDVEPGPEIQAAKARLLKLEIPAPIRPMVTSYTYAISRLVGRQVEWSQLQAAWQLATHHRTHFVCLLGEAGIGKTHLAEALLTWASQQGFAVARTRAYAGEGQLTYAPIIEWLRAEPTRAVRQQVAKVWLSEVARLVPEILTEQPTVPAPMPMTERWHRRQMWEAWARALLAAPQPMLLLIDDLQWCDQETLEWLRYLLHFDPKACVLVLGTARVEEIDDAHPLATILHHLRSTDQLTEIGLDPLNAEQTAILAAQLAQESLMPELQQALYRTTVGNPLFVVETVRAGLSREVGESLPLPSKVQAVIQYRLAQLSPTARELTHLAAIINRAFTFELLVQASGYSEDTLVQVLDELWQRRIMREQGTHTYHFSHDRIRDVAYAEISPIRRRQWHRQVAIALEQLQVVELDTMSGELAFHHEQAGLFEQAVMYYQQAAQAAITRYAYNEAIRQLQHALALLKSLRATRQAKAQELDIQITLGGLLRATKGLAAPEVGNTYSGALDLCRLVGNQTQRYIVQSKLFWYHANRGEFRTARQFADRNLALAQELKDQETLHDAHMGVGSIQLFVGEFAAALHQFSCALAIPVARRLRIEQVEADSPTFVSLALSALSLWLLGYPDQARQHVQQTLDLLQRYANPLDSVITLEFVLMVQDCLHDIEAMRTQAEEIAALATKYEFAMYQSLSTLYIGFVRASQGEPMHGMVELRHGLDWVKQSAVVLLIPYQLALLAEACRLAGQNTNALDMLDEALAVVDRTGETWWQAELFRRRGDLLLTFPTAIDDVQVWYAHAIDVARQQNAKSLELRAATSLARLWQQQGRSAEAYEVLAEIYHWFTEGFDTVDLLTAKTLLTELQASR